MILYACPVGWWDDLIPVISLIVVIGQETNFFFCEVPIGFLTTSVCVCVCVCACIAHVCVCVCACVCTCIVWAWMNVFVCVLMRASTCVYGSCV